MKTIEELYNEVIASEDLKKEFLALKPEEVEGFAEKHGCNATNSTPRQLHSARNQPRSHIKNWFPVWQNAWLFLTH